MAEGQPLKGRLISQFTVSLKRYPDTKPPGYETSTEYKAYSKGSGALMGWIDTIGIFLVRCCIQIKV